MKFTPPSEQESLEAIGLLKPLAGNVREEFLPRDDFEPVPPPGPNDWLAVHTERGQTFAEFIRSQPNKPDAVRNTIYIQPLEDFATASGPDLQNLGGFAEAFFAMPVKILTPSTVSNHRITTRMNAHTHQPQLLTEDILHLLRRILPANAFCILGITMRDLYPSASWNFVFGEASLGDRVGIFSFARYDPQFYGMNTAERDVLMLRRSCKVLAHEAGHMLGIQHCVFFNCLMNGSNHIEESDRRPLHLCPVDLRKLHYSMGFDVNERYRNLLAFANAGHLEDEARWIRKRLHAH